MQSEFLAMMMTLQASQKKPKELVDKAIQSLQKVKNEGYNLEDNAADLLFDLSLVLMKAKQGNRNATEVMKETIGQLSEIEDISVNDAEIVKDDDNDSADESKVSAKVPMGQGGEA